MKNKKALCFVELCVLAAASVPAVVGAQEIEEIMVTAQGREQSLQDVPVAVSVVNGDYLERENIKTLQDVSDKLANVKITTGSLVNSLNVRGAGSGENPGFEQAVATFADGVYRSRSRSTLAALFDVERVEVLKGPQSIFFGANAVAGALNISTRKPGQDFEYNLTGLYGTDGEYNLEGGVTQPISDTLSVRVAGRFYGMDGFVDNNVSGDGPDDESMQGRLSVNWEPTDNWQTLFRLDIVDSETTNNAPFEILNCPPPAGYPMSAVCGQILAANPTLDDELDYNSDAPGSYADYEFVEMAMTNTLDVSLGTIKSITSYSDQTYGGRSNLVPSPYPTSVQGFDPFPTSAEENYKFFSQEFRFESDTGGFLEYMLGAYYSKGELDYDKGLSGFFFLPFGAITESVFGDFAEIEPDTGMTGAPSVYVDDKMMSVFASATLNLKDNLRLNLGMRYSKIEKDASRSLVVGSSINAVQGTFVPFADDAQNAFCLIVGCSRDDFAQKSRTDKKFMPSIGLQFDASDNSMIYATYSTGFKSGGFSTTATPSTFGPENVDSYEVGLKGTYLDNSLTLNLAAFLLDYEGLQETVFDANLSSSIENAAESRSKGIEMTANWNATENISLNADIGYLKATYESYTDAGCTKLQELATAPRTQCVQDVSGKSRPYAPKWSGSLGANVILPLASGELRFSPSINYSSKYFMSSTADPLFEQGSYAKFDLNIAYAPSSSNWEVSLIGRNLTDKATTSYRLGTPGADGSITSLVERGRSVAIQFMLKSF